VIARSSTAIDDKRKEKIANSCSILKEQVISAPNVESIYEVPLNFEKDGLSDTILKLLSLKSKKTDIKDWQDFVEKAKKPKKEVSVAVVGKYFDSGDGVLSDAYISVIEAVKISAIANGAKVNLTWIDSKDFEKDPKQISSLKNFDGVIVPGGFGQTGIEGIIQTIKFTRENKIPYFGLCYGMQLMVIEYARNVLGLKDANTAEINPKAKDVVIDIMPDQKQKLKEGNYGGSMRLGAYKAKLKKGTIAESAYCASEIVERHRHRYEVNPEYIKQIEDKGLVFSGVSPDGTLMEIAELPKDKHPFFLGTQYHPEFLARPLAPHPLFSEFVKATLRAKK
jgi:CTP synthase